METAAIYFLKSSGLLLLFFMAYHFMLRKETFFNSNRWFLLGGLLTSAFLPLLVFTKTIWVDPAPNTIDWSNIPITTVVEEHHTAAYLYLALVGMYCMGITGLLIKFAFDFYSLNTLFKDKIVHKQGHFKFIDIAENIAPFSFYNTIVYNSSLYSAAELENIIEHEKVHGEQHHSTDLLISRLFCIVFWFNPFVWLYKKAILQNLEFIADSEASKKLSDKKAYQITLLKITTQENCIAITNHFYQSLIKKRIVMLNKNQSNKRNSWKYALVAPALVAFVLLFQIEVVAQEKESEFTIKSGATKVELHVTSNSTEKELNAEKDFFKKEFDLEMYFSKIKINKSNEITAIKVELKDKSGIKKVYQIDENLPIKPFNIYAEKDPNNKLNFGFSANLNDNRHLKNHFDHINTLNSNKKEIVNNNDPNEISSPAESTSSWSVTTMNKNGKEYLVVINGKRQSKGNPIKLPLNEEIDTQKILEPKEAVSKYGKEGKTGAFEITTKKVKTTAVKTNNNSAFDANTDIFIDGKKVSKKEMDSTNPDAIKTMNVTKTNGKSTVTIVTKTDVNDNASIFDYKTPAIELGLEKTDPTNLNSLQKPRANYTIKTVSIEKNGVPENTEYFIDGKKVSPLEVQSMSPNLISSMDVDKDAASNKNAIRIITKSYVDGKKTDKVEISTKNEDKGWAISFETSKPEDNMDRIQNDKNVDYKKALIIINGKQSNYRTMEELDPKNIISVGVQKPSNGTEATKQNAIKKYGKKALNGVIEITTK